MPVEHNFLKRKAEDTDAGNFSTEDPAFEVACVPKRGFDQHGCCSLAILHNIIFNETTTQPHELAIPVLQTKDTGFGPKEEQ